MEAKEIKEKIYSNIAGLLGTYRRKNLVTEAIWIGIPPQDFICTGLECLIAEFPESSNHGNQLLCEFWKITLTQYDGEDYLVEATRILRSLFRPSRVIFIQKPKTTEVQDLKILPQSIITYEYKEIYK